MRLEFLEDGAVNPQTMRGVRELSPESAAKLDEHTAPMSAFTPPGQTPAAL